MQIQGKQFTTATEAYKYLKAHPSPRKFYARDLNRALRASQTEDAPKPVLKDGAIYFADNGRAICKKCAGCSALFTGRDISGQKVAKATDADNAEWVKIFGQPLSCESGCTTFA